MKRKYNCINYYGIGYNLSVLHMTPFPFGLIKTTDRNYNKLYNNDF